jgi:hypothetical protein
VSIGPAYVFHDCIVRMYGMVSVDCMVNIYTRNGIICFFCMDSVRQLVAINIYHQTVCRYKFIKDGSKSVVISYT